MPTPASAWARAGGRAGVAVAPARARGRTAAAVAAGRGGRAPRRRSSRTLAELGRPARGPAGAPHHGRSLRGARLQLAGRPGGQVAAEDRATTPPPARGGASSCCSLERQAQEAAWSAACMRRGELQRVRDCHAADPRRHPDRSQPQRRARPVSTRPRPARACQEALEAAHRARAGAPASAAPYGAHRSACAPA